MAIYSPKDHRAQVNSRQIRVEAETRDKAWTSSLPNGHRFQAARRHSCWKDGAPDRMAPAQRGLRMHRAAGETDKPPFAMISITGG